jgi:hypothetical protein
MNQKEITPIVKSILETDIEARDNDRILCVKYWAKELGSNPQEWFLHLYSIGELTNHDTITRIRRKVQEENEHLRGNKYKARMENQKVVQRELGYEV